MYDTKQLLTWHFFYETKVRGIGENISLQYKFTKLKLTPYNNTHIYKNPSSIQIAKESEGHIQLSISAYSYPYPPTNLINTKNQSFLN